MRADLERIGTNGVHAAPYACYVHVLASSPGIIAAGEFSIQHCRLDPRVHPFFAMTHCEEDGLPGQARQ
jgi:hypothetical protein